MPLNAAFRRALPVGLALAPIGALFGILAAQNNWKVLDVFLLSLIGFSGSGQFAFLGFTSQGLAHVGLFAVFLIILSINLRYIPMSLSASQPLQTSLLKKLFLSHCLADESFAIERADDDVRTRATIRAVILLFWVLPAVAGTGLAALVPASINRVLTGLTFPVNAILVALSFAHVRSYCVGASGVNARRIIYIGCCVFAAVLLMKLAGAKYFWLPSIAASYLMLTPRHFEGKRV